MQILSNAEFEQLVSSQSFRLQTIARKRRAASPEGALNDKDITEYINICMYSGDRPGATWLKSLVAMAQSGELDRIRRGAMTYDEHHKYLKLLHASGKIKFGIGDHVLCKESGRHGTVADYIPDSKEYLVVLDPFIVRTFKADQLDKAG